MILILGSALDAHPVCLTSAWLSAGRDVVMATPRDLSQAGWRLRLGRPEVTTAKVGNRTMRADEIEVVVASLPWVGAYDLPHVVEGDRAYVAEEMSAFLLAWLTALPCRVVDRPSSSSLAGCGRSRFAWARLAAVAGIDARPDWAGTTTTVTVVGDVVVGDVEPATSTAACRLARTGGRTLVSFRFASGEPTFVGVEARPEVGSEKVAAALLEWIGR